MKTNYIVTLEDSIEAYCQSLKGVKLVTDRMAKAYICASLSAEELRGHTTVYRVTKVKVKP